MLSPKFFVTDKTKNDLKASFSHYSITEQAIQAMCRQFQLLKYCCSKMGDTDISGEEVRLEQGCWDEPLPNPHLRAYQGKPGQPGLPEPTSSLEQHGLKKHLSLQYSSPLSVRASMASLPAHTEKMFSPQGPQSDYHPAAGLLGLQLMVRQRVIFSRLSLLPGF